MTFPSSSPSAMTKPSSPHSIQNLHRIYHLQLLQVISDFDYTLTRWFLSCGKRAMSAHGTFVRSNELPPSYREEALRLYQHYYPIEIDTTLTKAEKSRHMKEWWTQAHDALLQHRVHSSMLHKLLAPTSEVSFSLRQLACAKHTYSRRHYRHHASETSLMGFPMPLQISRIAWMV